jgi:NADPH:quinone reductase-like Zn-dependent oxidoreductase
LLRELGADETVDYTTQRFEDIARDIDIVLDTIGGETQERSWRVLKKSGILLSLVEPPSADKAKAFGVRAAFVATIQMARNWRRSPKSLTQATSNRSSIESCPCLKRAARMYSVKPVTLTEKSSFE